MKTILLQQFLRIAGYCLVIVTLMSCADEESPIIPHANDDVPIDTLIWLNAGEQFNIPIDTYKGSATPTATLVDVFGSVRAVPANIMRIANRQWIVVKSTNLELVTGNIVVRLADSVVFSASLFVKALVTADPKLEISTCMEYSNEDMDQLCGSGGCVIDYKNGKFRRLDAVTSPQTRVIQVPRLMSIVGLVDGSGLIRQIQRWNFRTTPKIQLTNANRIVTGKFVTCLPIAEYKACFITTFDTTEIAIEDDSYSVPLGLATECKVVLYEGGCPVDSMFTRSSFMKAEMSYSVSADVSYTTTLRATTSSGSEYDHFSGTTTLTIPQTRVTNMKLETFDIWVSLREQGYYIDLYCRDSEVDGSITFFSQSIVDKGRTFVGMCRLEFRNARLVAMRGQNGYIVDMHEASFRPYFKSEINEGIHRWTLETDPTWLPARDVLTFSFAESTE